ncbi:response regulator transcription factor [Micromonospora krabiensis]|uniref:DNA-binding response regulator, OmpR family, contains REC and winged-helix (WHTH) domain n=1 Tax=Micromonospora krabiensis TaxID=307121 RepID=A0A1C3NDZ0_9ACTN|nr:response regulator transcription factor [Micromonospora krabiensis]SBV30805.1 DNA-binding response regulator, OmpR family, contains REC and winged-helix (wHTH) domain [Micromonospora krabiensis]
MTHRVLVVDDDHTVSDVVCRYLEHAGYQVEHVGDGAAALTAVARQAPHLVVLDLMLPTLNGLQVCRELRTRPDSLPIIILTALGDEADRILGLQLGADDYLTKPFSPRELVLRVQSVLRRAGGEPTAGRPQVLTDDGLVVLTGPRTAHLHNTELTLTLREFDLLVHFLRHPSQAFTRAELLERVWGWNFGDQSTVTVHVRRLREKIEVDSAAPRRIATVWGVGYRYDPAHA